MTDAEAWFDHVFPPLHNRGVRAEPDVFDPTGRVVFLVRLFLFELYGGQYAVYANYSVGTAPVQKHHRRKTLTNGSLIDGRDRRRKLDRREK